MGKAFFIWREEVPWFFDHIKSNYPELREWADAKQKDFVAHGKTHARIEWGMGMSSPLEPLFERAIADIDAARINREDGKRILPVWSTDGIISYCPVDAAPV